MGKGRGHSSDTVSCTTTYTTHGGYYGAGGTVYGGSMYGGSMYGGSMYGGYPAAAVTPYGTVYPPGTGYPPGTVYPPGTTAYPDPSVYSGYGAPGTVYPPGSVYPAPAPAPAPYSSVPVAVGVGTVPAAGPSPLPSGTGFNNAFGGGDNRNNAGFGQNNSGSANSNNNANNGNNGNSANNENNGNNDATTVILLQTSDNQNGRNGQGAGVGAGVGTGASVGGAAVGAAGVGADSRKGAGGRLFGQAIVVDNGGGLCKIGFAGEQYPRSVFPSLVGRPKHSGLLSQAAGLMSQADRLYVGSEAQIKRGILALTHPIEHGVVKDWTYMEAVWDCAWRTEMRVRPEDYPVLITEAPLNPTKNREETAAVLFEKFHVPALFVAAEAPLALYALGRKTGLVLEMGHGVCHAVPVVDGFTISNAILRLNAAGDDITLYLKRLLKEQGYSFPTTAEHELVQDIKEKHGYVALDPEAELKKPAEQLTQIYELPDGQKVTLRAERFRAPEVLFKPSILGMDTYGIPEMVAQSVEKCDLTLRNELLSNIVLSGGSSMFPGFPERLLKELQQLVPHNTNISIIAHPQRKFAVWHGGSVLASHPDFQSMWISKQAYEEHGPSILHNKIYQ